MNFLWLSLCWATPWPVLAENEHTLPPSIQVSKWMIPQDSWAVTTPILTPERLAIAAKNTSNFILQNKEKREQGITSGMFSRLDISVATHPSDEIELPI